MASKQSFVYDESLIEGMKNLLDNNSTIEAERWIMSEAVYLEKNGFSAGCGDFQEADWFANYNGEKLEAEGPEWYRKL